MKLIIIFFFSSILIACNQSKEITRETGIINRNGVDIAYTASFGGDTTLLFIHGWCINRSYWEFQFTEFWKRYSVITVDLPGCGESGSNRYDWGFDEFTQDIKYLITKLKLKNVLLIGHSMAGNIVLQADNQYPELLAGIIGVDNLHEPGGPMSNEQKDETANFFSLLKQSFDSTTNLYMKQNLFEPTTDSAIVNRVMTDIHKADEKISIAILESLSESSQKEQEWMKGLSHQLYLVNSDVHPVAHDSLKKYCSKGYDIELIPGTGHYPMIEKPEFFNKALQKILNKLSSKNKNFNN